MAKKTVARNVELGRNLKTDNNYFLYDPSRFNIKNHFYISTNGCPTTFQDGRHDVYLNNLRYNSQ
jgi:hypothetical protein